mgnify:CR=1 FL=1
MTAVRKDQLEDADRLSISLAYKDRESLPVRLPDDGIDQRLEGSRSLIGSFGWGRVLEHPRCMTGVLDATLP